MEFQTIKGKICLENACHYCCTETEMNLSKDDIRRILQYTSLHPSEFAEINEEGLRVLQNREVNGELNCVFLEEGKCSIYDIRPEGCQYYPIIWDRTSLKPMVDDVCPYGKEFDQLIPNVKDKLENFIFKIFGRL